MAVVVETANLLAATKRLNAVVARGSKIPILSNMLIEAAEGAITLTATDLDLQMQIKVAATTPEPLRITADAAALRDFAARCDKGSQISLSLEDGHRLALRSGRKSLTLMTLPAGDYPILRTTTAPTMVPVDLDDVQGMIRYCLPATSTEQTRYYLCGVYLHVVEGYLRAFATDGHSLAQADGPKWTTPCDVILPTKAAQTIIGLPAGGDVTLGATDSMVTLTGPDFELRFKVIDGTYPDYTRVIPVLDPDAQSITAQHADLTEAAAVVSLAYDGKTTRTMRFERGEGVLCVSGRSPDRGEAEMEIPATATGDGFAFGINARYLTQMLGEFERGAVEIRSNDPAAPILFTYPDAPDRLYVIMPMRV